MPDRTQEDLAAEEARPARATVSLPDGGRQERLV